MEGTTWKRIGPLFDKLLEVPEPDREAWLTSRCEGDTELYEEVWAFYLDAVQDDDFLECPLSRRQTPGKGNRIGPYELVSLLGAGGMGTVWLAERADGQFERRVAVKLIRPGMDTLSVLERFKAERQVLANLVHPGIASLLDGGTTEDGAPYLVMEYVRGRPLLEHADEHRLSIHGRLELFREVCAAVQFAHEHGVVHRDLKPSNIMVDAQGAKLLDFGVAKVLETGDLPSFLEQTLTAERFLSPRYASPEQLRGGPVGLSSDVYALGVILYELLTAKHPYGFETTSWREFEDQVFQQNPITPSRATESPEAAQELDGELDQVVLFALRKEPERRYASAAALSADIERYLNGEPVRAHPDSLGYRAGKFVQRNRRLVMGTAAFVCLLSLALAFSLRSYLRATRAEERARLSAYVAHVGAAEIALNGGHAADALLHLEQAPEPERGWEWRHLQSRTDRSLRHLQDYNTTLAVAPEAGLLALSRLPGIEVLDIETLEPTVLLEDFFAREGISRLDCSALAFTPSGDRLLATLSQKAVVCYDLETGLIDWATWADTTHMALAPPEGRAYVDRAQGRVAALSLDDGAVLEEWQAHRRPLQSIATSPGARLLATGSWDGEITVWSLGPRQELLRLQAHASAVKSLSFSPDGARLVSSGYDEHVRVWNAGTGEQQLDLPERGFVEGATFSPSGDRIFSTSKGGYIASWDASTGERLETWIGHTASSVRLQVDPVRKRVISSGRDGIREWHLNTQDVRSIAVSLFSSSVAFAPDRALVANGGPDRILRLFDLESGTQTQVECQDMIMGLAFSPSERRLAMVLYSGDLSLRDASSGRELHRREARESPRDSSGYTIDYSPDGRHFLACTRLPWFQVHNARTLEPVFRFELESDIILSARYHPDGTRIVTGATGGLLWIIDADTGERLGKLRGIESNVTALGFDITGKTLVSGHEDGRIQLWSLDKRERLAILSAHTEGVTSISSHPDGKRMATSGRDGGIRIWDVPKKTSLVTLHGHDSAVASLDFSPDGKTLASCSYECVVKLWESE